MFDPKSDYALNKKDKDAIVCPSVTGVHTRLVREDFASEEDFLYWKALSDSDYKKIEAACRDYNDNCIRLTADRTTGESVEDVLLAPLLKTERAKQRAALLKRVKDLLTQKQYHRMWMLLVDGLTVEQIAQRDGVTHQSISECLTLAWEKIVNNL